MKNNIIIIALIVFTSVTTNAQNQFGVFGGVNSSSISDGFIEKFDFNGKITLHIGVLYEYEISNKILLNFKFLRYVLNNKQYMLGFFLTVQYCSVE